MLILCAAGKLLRVLPDLTLNSGVLEEVELLLAAVPLVFLVVLVLTPE
jgi:hypothetical protein